MQGITLGPYGLPQRLGLVPRDPADALRATALAGHLHAALNKQASLNLKHSLLHGAEELRDKARLRSSGGPSAGHFFTTRAIGIDDVVTFDDEKMVAAVRWRLGVPQLMGPTRRCRLSPGGTSCDAAHELQQRSARGECGLPIVTLYATTHLWSRLATPCATWAAKHAWRAA